MNRFDIEFLESFEGYPSVSCYIPTYRSMPEKAQDSIKLKNIIHEVRNQFNQNPYQAEFDVIINTLEKLSDSIDFSQLSDGLALFANVDCARAYILPFSVPELISIDTTFNVRPLIRGLHENVRYWLLVLDEEPTRLYEGKNNHVAEFIHPLGTPSSQLAFPLSEELPEDDHVKAVGKGDLDARYLDDRKLHFFRKIDDALGLVLAQEPLPVILVGTEKNRALFKEATRHIKVIIGEIEGDFVKNPLQICVEKAGKLIQDHAKKVRQNYLDDIEEAINKKQFTFGLQEVWRAANSGRIATLLIEDEYAPVGKIDDQDPLKVVLSTQDHEEKVLHDLGELLIELVTSKRGSVIFYPRGTLGEYKQVAALLRY
jgi:hypothetical protein